MVEVKPHVEYDRIAFLQRRIVRIVMRLGAVRPEAHQRLKAVARRAHRARDLHIALGQLALGFARPDRAHELFQHLVVQAGAFAHGA